MDIPILFEDEDVVVINKPAGIAAHPDGRRKETTVSDWFLRMYPNAKSVGEPLVLPDGLIIERPGIVHRLDKETSGVMILAKTPSAHAHLKAQFQERHAEKTYRTFLWGELKKPKGIITLAIGRSRSDFRKRSAEKQAKPPLRDARTDYETLVSAGGFSYVDVRPKTGRMHQIRVHFKALQHPVVGDMLYAPKKEYTLGFNRLALHAHTLSLTLPSGGRKTFTAPLPEDFVTASSHVDDLLKEV